jgi:hypothetical protein
MKRRDLLDASKLLRRHKMDPSDMAALGLAAEYLSEKKDEKTTLGFQAWLDVEIEEDDDEDAEVVDDADAPEVEDAETPTEP